jgi:polyisoprenoid-binding protein YceI
MATILVQVAAAASLADGTFVVSERRSSVLVHVGKAGALSFAGHRHEVAAPVTGLIRVDPGDLGASSVELTFATARFRVLTEGEPEGDAPKVEEVMRGPRVLDSARFGEIRFRSRTVSGRAVGGAGVAAEYEVQVTGDLTVLGVTREVVVPMKVVLDGDTLRARGQSTIRHDQFGLTPVTAAGGTVRVRNEIEIGFDIVAERRHDSVAAPGER